MAEQIPPIAAIRELLAYNWANEERDYAEHLTNGDHDACLAEPPCTHIFLPMQEISAWLTGQGNGRGRRHSPGWAGSGYERG